MFDHLEENFAEELAYEIDEDPEDVSATVEFLHQCGLLVELSEVERYLPEVVKNIGSEGASAKRTRELREREKRAASQCDGTALQCDGEASHRHGEKEKSKSKRREEESGAPDGATPPAPSAGREKKPARKEYGQYGWVKLSDEEYSRLSNDLGQAELERCIAYIDESAQSTGNKNKWRDWNLVIRRCHRDRWGLGKGASKPNARPIPSDEDYLDYLKG